MNAYLIHNRSNASITFRSRAVPKFWFELKKDGTHMFESEKEYILYQDVVTLHAKKGRIKLEVINQAKTKVDGGNIFAAAKIETKVEAPAPEVNEDIEEQKAALKGRLESLQTEYKSKETTNERKSRIKEEVNSIKKAISALKA